MLLVIPMAGSGQRFKDEGFTTLKPFINVSGQWMVEWALKSFDLAKIRKIIFLVRKDHDKEVGAVEKLKQKYGKQCECVIVNGPTEGAACTALLAKEYLDTDEDIIIKDSDGYILSDIHRVIQKKPNGLLGILSTVTLREGDSYSFARTDSKGYVVEVAERKRISDNVIAGLYYFIHGSDFVKYAEQMIKKDKRVNGEFYVAPVYQEMIEDGKKVAIDPVEALWNLGTPEGLTYFLKNYKGV